MDTTAKGVTGRDIEPQHMKDQTLPRGESIWTCLASHRAMGVWVGGAGNTVPGLLVPLVEGWGWGLGLKLKENNQQRCSFCFSPPAQRLSLLIQSALSRVFNPSLTQQLLLRSPDFPQNLVQCSSVIQSCLILCNLMDWACQASLSYVISWSLLKLMSIELMIPSNYLILCRPLLLLPSIFPSISVFSNE